MRMGIGHRLAVGVIALAGTLCAQDIAGVWQGTLKPGTRDLRIVIEIRQLDDGSWKALLHNIDQNTEVIAADSVSREGSSVKLSFGLMGASYGGTISADSAVVAGTWTQGRQLPFELHRATRDTEWPLDSTPHTVQFIRANQNISLEVLDWGGSGRPLVLLTGLGNTAHIFDKFAPKLISSWHVYGITRRGFGASSSPPLGYSADQLGDDVLAVLDSLKLNHPVLAGHSIAGEELSSIASRHPEKVAGVIYLEAGYAYAYYNPPFQTLDVDINELRQKLNRLQAGIAPRDAQQLTQELLETSLPGLERDLRENQKDLDAMSALPGANGDRTSPPVIQAMQAGKQKYTRIPVPALAIFAVPHANSGNPTLDARDLAITQTQSDAFEKGVPSARVVRLPQANHYIFISNEADVLREIDAFIARLPGLP
jgi:non-heme chloroperoxidase